MCLGFRDHALMDLNLRSVGEAYGHILTLEHMLLWSQGTDASQVNAALDLAESFASLKLN